MARVRVIVTDKFLTQLLVKGTVIPRHRVLQGLSSQAKLVGVYEQGLDELTRLALLYEDPTEPVDRDIIVVIEKFREEGQP